MQRLEVFFLTGAVAKNHKIAHRLNRKARSLLLLRQTVLLDFDHVTDVDPSFFAVVLDLPDRTSVKVCGLNAKARAALLDDNVAGAADTLVP